MASSVLRQQPTFGVVEVVHGSKRRLYHQRSTLPKAKHPKVEASVVDSRTPPTGSAKPMSRPNVEDAKVQASMSYTSPLTRSKAAPAPFVLTSENSIQFSQQFEAAMGGRLMDRQKFREEYRKLIRARFQSSAANGSLPKSFDAWPQRP